MNFRLFLTSSSLILLGWMAASYFSVVPLEGYSATPAQRRDATAVSALAKAVEDSPGDFPSGDLVQQ